MKIDDYPPQEPTPAFAAEYAAEVKRRSEVPHEDIAYGDDIYQRVAVFAPALGTANGTVLAAIHGGGWTSGYKEWMAFQAPAFNAAGVLFISIGYRLAPTHVFPAGYDDVRHGIAWIQANAAGYGGDPERLFVTGHSAGGHYAALMAVKRDWQAELDLPRDVIRGWLPVSGVFDFTAGSGLSIRPRFLGPRRFRQRGSRQSDSPDRRGAAAGTARPRRERFSPSLRPSRGDGSRAQADRRRHRTHRPARPNAFHRPPRCRRGRRTVGKAGAGLDGRVLILQFFDALEGPLGKIMTVASAHESIIALRHVFTTGPTPTDAVRQT